MLNWTVTLFLLAGVALMSFFYWRAERRFNERKLEIIREQLAKKREQQATGEEKGNPADNADESGQQH